MLNELVVFHYLLNEKHRYKEKLWNQGVYFDETDLNLNVKYLHGSSPEELKKLYPDIVADIIYGGKVTDQDDVETIRLHITEAIRQANLDRSYFWQTVWADDKFPKNQQEHEHYLKASVLQKHTPPFKNIFEIYGITSFVLNHQKQQQYRSISEFYNATRKAD